MKNYKFEGKTDFYVVSGKNGLSGVVGVISNFTGNSQDASQRRRKKSITSHAALENAVVFICGGVKLGTKSPSYYNAQFSILDEIGEKNNIEFIIVRSNGDDPSLFSDEKVKTKHVIAVEDYSTVTIDGHKAICIGGGVSYDRSWVKSHTPEKYFDGEEPFYCDVDIDFSEIDTIVTSSLPSFVNQKADGFKVWGEMDATLKNDVMKEMNVMDKLYVRMADGKNRTWTYTKYPTYNTTTFNDIMFKSPGKLTLDRLTVPTEGISTSTFGEWSASLSASRITPVDYRHVFRDAVAPPVHREEELRQDVDPYIHVAQADVQAPVEINMDMLNRVVARPF